MNYDCSGDIMELTKTAKLQIYTSKDEKALLLDSMRAYSDACNYVSNYIYTTKDLSQVSVQVIKAGFSVTCSREECLLH